MTNAHDRYGRNGRARCPQRAERRCEDTPPYQCGYTVVELLVTILLVSVLAATVGTFFVKLLNIQEREREEAYVREKLADICGAYADALSVGSAFSRSNTVTVANFRMETGGVSFETGIVTSVTCVTSLVNVASGTLDSDVYGYEATNLVRKLSRIAHADPKLIALRGSNVAEILKYTLKPLNNNSANTKMTNGFETTDAALGWLSVDAQYRIKDKDGDLVGRTVTVERVVRLWNKE